MVVAVWHSGIAQAEQCLDPDAYRRPPLRLADAAILLLLFALVPFALNRGLRRVAVPPGAIAVAHLVVLGMFGLAAARLLRAQGLTGSAAASPRPITSPVVVVIVGGLCGLATRGLRQLLFQAGPPLADVFRQPPVLALLLAIALSEELVLRGVVQGTVERELGARGRAAPWIAAAAGVAAAQFAAPEVTGLSLLLAAGPAVARAGTGRLLAACAARVIILLAGG
jgi:membrane protease YdiL (CAAX protease family)